jgi:hypothetical protein
MVFPDEGYYDHLQIIRVYSIVDWTAGKGDRFGKSFQTTQPLWKHEFK